MKRQMKKKLAVLLSLVLIISLALAGCKKKKEEIPEPDKLAEAYYLRLPEEIQKKMAKYGHTEKRKQKRH